MKPNNKVKPQSNISQNNDNNASNNIQKKPKKKCVCEGRGGKVDVDLYYKIKEENEKLKKDRKLQDERIKKLEVSLVNIKENIIKERKQADYKVINNNNDYNSDIEKTKQENRKLKSENEKKNMIIQGLQSNALIIKAKGKSKNKKREKDPLTSLNEKNEYLACISRLREQLKIANEDRRTLISELRTRQLSVNTPNYNDRNILNNKINSQLQNAAMKLDTNDKILELTNRNLKNYIEKYEKERENVRKLQTELSLLKGENEKIPQYKILIDELKNSEKKLEEELNELRISPFIQQVEERGNVFRNIKLTEQKMQEIQKELDEKEKELREQKARLNELEKENKKLKEDLENDYKDVDNCIKTEGVKTKEDDQKSTEKEVVYPDFTTGGYKIEDVEEFCKKYGLKLEVFYNEPDGTQIPSGKLPEENTVFVQEPVPGEKVVKGDTLHITIAVY